MPTMPKQPEEPLSEVNTGLTDSTSHQNPFLQVNVNVNEQTQDSGSKIAKQSYLDVLYDEWIFKLKQEKVIRLP